MHAVPLTSSKNLGDRALPLLAGGSVAPRRNKVQSPGVHIIRRTLYLLHIVRRGATDPLSDPLATRLPAASIGIMETRLPAASIGG